MNIAQEKFISGLTEKERRAYEIAKDVFKDMKMESGSPYYHLDIPAIDHSVEIARRCTTENERVVAFLHDVVGRNLMKASDLEKDFPDKEIIDALRLLENEPDLYIFNYVKKLAENPIAAAVKYQDYWYFDHLATMECGNHYMMHKLAYAAWGYEYIKHGMIWTQKRHRAYTEEIYHLIRNGRVERYHLCGVFPQLVGTEDKDCLTDHSLLNVAQAKEYLDDVDLRDRLDMLVDALGKSEVEKIEDLVPDEENVRIIHRSMTLFDIAYGKSGSRFRRVLNKYFNGVPDEQTVAIIKAQQHEK